MIPDKQQTVTEFLAVGETHLIFDPRQPGVQVPDEMRELPELRLKFSYAYDTGALLLSSMGVRQSLKFGDRVVLCVVPWKALVAAVVPSKNLGCGWERPPAPVARPRHLRVVN